MFPSWLSRPFLRVVAFAVLGAAGGYAYYHFIGCASGHCPITSNPYISTGYGAAVGVLMGIPVKKKK